MACGGTDPLEDARSVGEQSGFLSQLDVQDETKLEYSGLATTEPLGFEDIDGVVALPTSPAHHALQTSERTAADGSTNYFATTRLFWTAPVTFELSVPAGLRSSMAIGWGVRRRQGKSFSADVAQDDLLSPMFHDVARVTWSAPWARPPAPFTIQRVAPR